MCLCFNQAVTLNFAELLLNDCIIYARENTQFQSYTQKILALVKLARGQKKLILHLSCRTSDLQFSLILQSANTHTCPLKVYAKKNISE